jgi:hypothetical protein
VSFTINPKTLTLPEEAFYAITELELFDRHDRASWEREFGEQAPPFDNTRAPKVWADTSVLEGVEDPDTTYVEYNYFDTASRSFQKLKLSVREASEPNLTGDYIYPSYVVAPTEAVMINPDGGEASISAKLLSYRAEADQLAEELGATSVVENQLDSAQFQIDWRGEQRRIWVLRIGDEYYSAALLLQRKYRQGIGYPGEWDFEGNGQPIWVLQQPDTGVNDSRSEVPIPSRELFAEEALYLNHPMKVVVYRTDKSSDYNQADTSSTTTFPSDLRSMLERIDSNIQQLLALQFSD